MLRTLIVVLILAAAGGCGDECVNGVCPDSGYATLRPGPCESGYDDGSVSRHCTFGYDGDVLVTVDCTWAESATDGEHGTDHTAWEYDAGGQPSHMEMFHDDLSDGIGSHGAGYAWTADQVQQLGISWDQSRHVSATYERATFAFFPMLGSEVMTPEPDLTQATVVGVTYTTTQDGATYTRTPSDGSPAIVYDLDDVGRVTRWTNGDVTETTTYDRDRITGRSLNQSGQQVAWTCQYEHGGNVAGWTQTGRREAYSYACWR